MKPFCEAWLQSEDTLKFLASAKSLGTADMAERLLEATTGALAGSASTIGSTLRRG